MKKLLVLLLAAAFALPLNAQTDSSKTKPTHKTTTTPHKSSTKKKEDQADEGDNKPKTKAEKEKEKREKEKVAREAKLKEQREKAKAKLEEQKEARKAAAEKLKEKQAAQKAGSQNKTGTQKGTLKTTHPTGKTTTTTKSKTSKKEEEEKPEKPSKKGEITQVGGNVLTYYEKLPLEDLPQIEEYIKSKNADVAGAKVEDTKDLRKGFIRDQNLERGFLQLQLGVDMRYTRLQMYTNKKGEVFMGIETYNCEASNCNSDLKFYKKAVGSWQDVTGELMPKLDYKSMAKRLKDRYKEEYLDLDVYNSRGYENPETLKASITYNISPEENKILVKETYLPFVLYDMTWNEGKGKFDLKKK